MTCELCRGISVVWMETEEGLAMRVCPWCRAPGDRTEDADPYRVVLDLAGDVFAEIPDASDDAIARRLHARCRDIRVLRPRRGEAKRGGDGL